MEILIDKGYGIEQVEEIALIDLLKKSCDKSGNVKTGITIFKSARIEKTQDGKLEFVLSDFSVDRDLERIDPDGWELEEFKLNPVMLWAHDMKIPAIGRWDNVRIEGGQLRGTPVFDLGDPLGAAISRKVEQGIINTVSVGFMPKKIQIVEEKDKPERLVHLKQTLYEGSFVNVPSNPNARRRELDKDTIERTASAIGEEVADKTGKKLDSLFGKDQARKEINYLFDQGGNGAKGDTSQTLNTGLTAMFGKQDKTEGGQ